MPKAEALKLTIFAFTLLFFAQLCYSSKPLTIEFIYWDPHLDPNYCETCPTWIKAYEAFAKKNETVASLSQAYMGKVDFQWIDSTSPLGIEKKRLYQVSSNSLVINGTVKIEGEFNETYIKEVIDNILNNSSIQNEPSKELMPTMALAFSFGFLETFSPCLLAMLSFILSYTLGESFTAKKSFSKIMLFGLGFVAAAFITGLSCSLVFLSLYSIQKILMWAVCVLAIILSFNLLGFFSIPMESKPLLQKLTRKYVLTFGGLLILGFLFYFLDPCIAPIFFAMLPLMSPNAFSIILLIFCIGVLTPFFLIGLLAEFISKMARISYKHKSKIRAVSGLILLTYTIYIIAFYLI
ncbi:MAG: cytochrome c biogenesis CcdA family protein [Candidatus Bathyarchaeales archaeon]